MKTVIKRLLVLAACFSLAFGVAACSQDTTTTTKAVPYSDAAALLSAVWEADDDADKPTVIGGIGATVEMDVPQPLDLEDPTLLSASLYVPEALPGSCESASSIMNAMMANAFCASVWQLKEGQNLDDWAQKVAETISAAQWLCTSPEVYQIYTCGQYLIVVFGYSSQVDGFASSVNTTLKDYGVKELFNEVIEN